MLALRSVSALPKMRRLEVNKWQKLHEQYAQNVFQGKGHVYTQEAKIAELERLIGQQTVEISLLPH